MKENPMDENSLNEQITKFYLKYLKRKPDEKGFEYFYNEIQNQRMTIDAIPSILSSSEEFKALQREKHACIYTIYGTKMYLNPDDSVISKFLNLHLYWEKEESEFFKNQINDGMKVVDIGANIGYFTLLFSKWVGQNGKVYSFEPELSNFDLLKKNINANNFSNIIFHKKAISNYDGDVSLYLSEKNIGDHRLFNFQALNDNYSRKSIKVECSKLDSIISEKDKIDLIKMDIQGAEFLALDGMQETLNKNRDILLLTEFWPYAIEKSGHSPEEFLEKLKQFSFEIFVFDNNKLIPLQQDNPIIQDYDKFEFVNLICKK